MNAEQRFIIRSMRKGDKLLGDGQFSNALVRENKRGGYLTEMQSHYDIRELVRLGYIQYHPDEERYSLTEKGISAK